MAIIDDLESIRITRGTIINPLFVELEIGEVYYSIYGEEGLMYLLEGFESKNIELQDFRYSDDYTKIFFEVL